MFFVGNSLKIMLSINVNQELPNLAECSQSNGTIIDTADIFTVRRHFTIQYQLTFFIQCITIFGQLRIDFIHRLYRKSTFYNGFVTADSNVFAIGTGTKQQGYRIDNNGFPRTGFPGQYIEMLIQF